MMDSLTMSEEMMSSTSCVTTTGSPKNFLTDLPQTYAMPEVYVVNLIQINPLWRAVGVSFFAVGYVVVIDLPVQLAMGEV